MPYGVRAYARGGNPFVRSHSICWLQAIGGGPHADHIQLIGLNNGRTMVSFWIDPAEVDKIGPAYFIVDQHRRLGFATLDSARQCANTIADGNRTSEEFRVRPSSSSDFVNALDASSMKL